MASVMLTEDRVARIRSDLGEASQRTDAKLRRRAEHAGPIQGELVTEAVMRLVDVVEVLYGHGLRLSRPVTVGWLGEQGKEVEVWLRWLGEGRTWMRVRGHKVRFDCERGKAPHDGADKAEWLKIEASLIAVTEEEPEPLSIVKQK